MIKAIPTAYRSITFRSKLEKAYAQCLDSLGIVWQYEVEGYLFQNTAYLPDFWLPDISTFLEVKGPLVPGIEKVIQFQQSLTITDYWHPEFLVLVGDAAGQLFSVGIPSTIWLVQCRDCSHYWFMPVNLSFQCRHCQCYDGDHHIARFFENLFLPQ